MTDFQTYNIGSAGTGTANGDISVGAVPSNAGGNAAYSSSGTNGNTALGMLSATGILNPSSLETVQSNLVSVFTKSRPWGEFANTKAMSVPTAAELQDRVQENFRIYMYNYLFILFVLSGFAVLTNPLSLLGIAAIFIGYMYLFVYHQGGLKVGNYDLDTSQKRTIVLVVFGCVVLWLTGAGSTLSTLVLTVGAFAVAHAAFKKSPNEADFETAFSPSV